MKTKAKKIKALEDRVNSLEREKYEVQRRLHNLESTLKQMTCEHKNLRWTTIYSAVGHYYREECKDCNKILRKRLTPEEKCETEIALAKRKLEKDRNSDDYIEHTI